MASSGNTWCKKLMAKDKANKARWRYGSIVPIMDRIGMQRRGRVVLWPDDSGRVLKPHMPEGNPLPYKAPLEPWQPRKHFLRVAYSRIAKGAY